MYTSLIYQSFAIKFFSQKWVLLRITKL